MKKPRPKKSAFWREGPLFEEGEIFSTIEGKRGTSLFLGRYTLNEVIAVLDKKAFSKKLKKENCGRWILILIRQNFLSRGFKFFIKKRNLKT